MIQSGGRGEKITQTLARDPLSNVWNQSLLRAEEPCLLLRAEDKEMAMNSYVLSGLGGGGGGIREPRTAEQPVWHCWSLGTRQGLGPPGRRGLRLCAWDWGALSEQDRLA